MNIQSFWFPDKKAIGGKTLLAAFITDSTSFFSRGTGRRRRRRRRRIFTLTLSFAFTSINSFYERFYTIHVNQPYEFIYNLAIF